LLFFNQKIFIIAVQITICFKMPFFTSIEICAGAGGQALGLEMAGFEHRVLVEIDSDACKTLRANRPEWEVQEKDVKDFSAISYKNIDLFAGGVPCPPFSVAGKQLGKSDERDLFPEALRLIEECRPKAVMLENVRGLLSKKFDSYRRQIQNRLLELGYKSDWRLVNASDFGVPQLRPRAILLAFRDDYFEYYKWPEKNMLTPKSVGQTLFHEMSSKGWHLAEHWRDNASSIAPTLVGGSKKHGGADLGPTRARESWKKLGVDGRGLADSPPDMDFQGLPRLTLKMTSLIQGFPEDWEFQGKKTPAYRQIGNAFPPPVAKAIGESIIQALKREMKHKQITHAPELFPQEQAI
jgi:DNA (cytosine-5)-methyltransferase 1